MAKKLDIPGSDPALYKFDPLAVGEDVGRYYTSALSEQPGYQQIVRNIRGVLSPETRYNVGQAAAEYGVGIGSYGSPAQYTKLLKDIGLDTNALQNLGLQQYLAAYGAVPGINPADLYISAPQREQYNLQWQSQLEAQRASLQQIREQIANQQKLAEMGQATQFGITGMNIAAGERAFNAQLQAAKDYQELSLAQQARLENMRMGSQTGSPYGPFYGTNQAAGGATVFGGTSTQDLFGSFPGSYGDISSGTWYQGPTFPNYTVEQQVMSGQATPESQGLVPQQYNYNAPMDYSYNPDPWGVGNYVETPSEWLPY